jgi:hypothetical protein
MYRHSDQTSTDDSFLFIINYVKLSDPRTYNSLIHHIEAPFCRLKAILNAKACYQYQSLPPSVRQDLLSLVNCWIAREGYLLLFVQVDSFRKSIIRITSKEVQPCWHIIILNNLLQPSHQQDSNSSEHSPGSFPPFRSSLAACLSRKQLMVMRFFLDSW